MTSFHNFFFCHTYTRLFYVTVIILVGLHKSLSGSGYLLLPYLIVRVEVYRYPWSHTVSPGRVIGPSQRPLPTQQGLDTAIPAIERPQKYARPPGSAVTRLWMRNVINCSLIHPSSVPVFSRTFSFQKKSVILLFRRSKRPNFTFI